VPAGRPIQFSLTSGSVMNAFFIPRLGSMIYTMNGMVTKLHLQADRPGVYYGRSTMFSGDGFPDMEFATRAMSEADFAAWAARMKTNGPVLDRAAYTGLARQSQAVKPYGYRAVEPRLFDAVARQEWGQSPGPQKGRGGDVDVHPQPETR
jgi:cytochrome o ubiquinol oxidase subunit 2